MSLVDVDTTPPTTRPGDGGQRRELTLDHFTFLTSQGLPGEFARQHAYSGSDSEGEGICFPLDDHAGHAEVIFRPDVPLRDKDGKLKKYKQPYQVTPVINRPVPRANPDTIWFIEGMKQHLVGAAYAPESAEIWGLQGCYNWQKDGVPFPLLDKVSGKRVLITMDADASTNHQVWSAAVALKDACKQRGAKEAWFSTVPGRSKDGLDDVVARIETDAARRALVERMFITTTEWPGKVKPLARYVDEDGKKDDRPMVNVGSVAEAANWLMRTAGKGRLSGLFVREGILVYTPRLGEDGYKPLSERETKDGEHDSDGMTQVRPMDAQGLAAFVRHRYLPYKVGKTKKGEEPVTTEAMFPLGAAIDLVSAAYDAQEQGNLRALRGVVSTPIMRKDGSICSTPGYDDATRLLYMPIPGVVVPTIPESPTTDDVRVAVSVIDEMLAGFPFKNDDHRANYIGALLTPALRTMIPPPYKLVAIEAHQPGSGKTLLAKMLQWVHDAVFRTEFPEDDTELTKSVTAILQTTTAPVVIFDNVSGLLKSSKLAGLLTTTTDTDRVLGTSRHVRSINDRMWTITGNNLSIGGDLTRRTLRTAIDPGMPNPETRTSFAIKNMHDWIERRRGIIVASLLTIARAWVMADKPLGPERTSDDYTRWNRSIQGILTVAKIPGVFDGEVTKTKAAAAEDEWGRFLAAIREYKGQGTWTAKEILETVAHPGVGIDEEFVPEELSAKRRYNSPNPVQQWAGLSRSLGKWLGNRERRWYGNLTVTSSAVESGTKSSLWKVITAEEARAQQEREAKAQQEYQS